ncbi:MAG: hypothetical protein K0U29_08215 [Gammaproteobacteria bacterium]|nr:hypothetical protein [Gammaproteobacteria bacterium]MCH9744895.1 hypothetical protein [Gammaproteobacteria bacterium]
MPQLRNKVFTTNTTAKAPLFTYVFDTCTTFGEKCRLLLGGISIRGTVLTLYDAMTQPITDQEFPDLSTDPAVMGMPHRDFRHKLVKTYLPHDIQHLHPPQTPAQLKQHISHSHIDLGSIISPEILKECLDHIVQQQEDIVARKNALDPKTNMAMKYKLMALMIMHGADNQPVLDAETPFIDKTQIPGILDEYTRYYNKYKTVMGEDLKTFEGALEQHHQEELEKIARAQQEQIDQFLMGVEDVARTAASSAIEGALSSAMTNVLRKSLNTCVDNESTEWVLHALNIVLSLYLSSTVYPALFATTALGMSKLAGMDNTHARLSSNAVSMAANIAMNHSSLTALKTGVSLVSGFAGGLFGHHMVERIAHYTTAPKAKIG